MASIGHIVVGMAAARVYQREQATRWSIVTSMFIWSVLSLLPDADVIGFWFGIRYADPWGHRGATHSIVSSVVLGCVVGLLGPIFGVPRLRTAVCAILVLVSHAVLDTLTDGGLGCALFWPFDENRYFAPWEPIPVAPIGRAYFSKSGFRVAAAEFVIFFPVLVYALWWRTRQPAGATVEAEPPKSLLKNPSV
jgi:inner membrane protein